MNHAINVTTAMIVGFFAGVGVNYATTQTVIEMQARKIAAVTDANYTKQSECAQLINDLTRRRK